MKLTLGFILFLGVLLSAKLLAVNQAAVKSTRYHEVDNVKHQVFKINSRIDGLQLALHSASPLAKTKRGTILLLHGSSFPSQLSFGFTISGKSWVDQLTSLGYQVYSLDFLGYGDSDRYSEMIQGEQNAEPLGRGVDVLQDVNLAAEFILTQDKVAKIDVLGHSWGGAVAAHFAERYPEKVEHLVLYAGITTAQATKSAANNTVPAYSELTPELRIQSLASLSPEADQPLLAQEMFKTWGVQWLASDPLASDELKVRYPAGPNADVADFFQGVSFYNPKSIRAKVLIIRGEHDQYPSNEQAYQLFNALTNTENKRYVVINNGTHVLHLEQNRHQLYQSVNDFLLMPVNNR
ncbi:hypothetical protein tinsulaeT_31520 [Thalassotalea insulae]|uniref:Serine aminopeptidase S33 domain-containing protein n=1 Tax=Thalassotalea insulae TaxID=2056778 RepID=A0ABQ6GVA8_9GAMM|nr:alpha/beta hydrolase [Thalassotalea insulae]GLX79812.1 hypothetical protein tinsulaeT_31520 [Thalassotalea insulae]